MLHCTQRFAKLLLWAGVALSVAAGGAAHAITNGSDTISFNAVGELGFASGVQIAESWIVTAAHVAAGVVTDVSTFQGLTGASVVDQVYFLEMADGVMPDIALLHLAQAIQDVPLPSVNDGIITQESVAAVGQVTMVTAQNQSPNGFGVATLHAVATFDSSDGSGSSLNWLITEGEAAVEGGDSGGALFMGTPQDSANAVLLGVVSLASYEFTFDGDPSASAFVPLAPYKDWIDATMMPSGEQVQWVTAIPAADAAVVPEPGTCALWALGLLGITMSQRRAGAA
jgi:Trypsin